MQSLSVRLHSLGRVEIDFGVIDSRAESVGHPILMPLAIISVVGGAFIFAYISYVEVTRVGPQYHKTST
jgi:uncharacterized protein (DUF2062 family)